MSKFFCNRNAWVDSVLFNPEDDVITPLPTASKKPKTRMERLHSPNNRCYTRRKPAPGGQFGPLTQGIHDALSSQPMRFGQICAMFPGNLRQNIKCSLETLNRRGLLLKEGQPGRNLGGNDGYLFKIVGVDYGAVEMKQEGAAS